MSRTSSNEIVINREIVDLKSTATAVDIWLDIKCFLRFISRDKNMIARKSSNLQQLNEVLFSYNSYINIFMKDWWNQDDDEWKWTYVEKKLTFFVRVSDRQCNAIKKWYINFSENNEIKKNTWCAQVLNWQCVNKIYQHSIDYNENQQFFKQ